MSNRVGQWHWYDPIYRSNFALVSCKPEQAPKRLCRVLPGDVAREADVGGRMNREGLAGKSGRCCCISDTDSGDVLVFWIAAHADVSVIAHEAFHATYWILKRKGLSLDESSEEAYTYFLEWLVREITSRITRVA